MNNKLFVALLAGFLFAGCQNDVNEQAGDMEGMPEDGVEDPLPEVSDEPSELRPGMLYDAFENYECVPGDRYNADCDEFYALECKDSHFYVKENCHDRTKSSFCESGYGCVDCMPGSIYCGDDNNVYTCSADGLTRTMTQACGINVCRDGQCFDDNCPIDAQFIYLIDSQHRLIKFNPSDPSKKYFSVLSSLSCLSSIPFSMAVDRQADAWILSWNAELYKVGTTSKKCKKVHNFNSDSSGLHHFGMAFSLDHVGWNSDSLFISVDSPFSSFGQLETEKMGYTGLANFPKYYENTPELTGTGLAKLFAFSPGIKKQYISEIDKTTGKVVNEYELEGTGGKEINAWAFAHWGGSFYIFETVDKKNKVLKFDPTTKELSVFLESTKYEVSGAGVSTCAPIEDTVIN